MIATHLGVIDEEKINNMSYLFFQDVLEELGHKLSYEAVVNYAGNSFVEKSWDMIQDANPFNVDGKKKMSNSQAQGFVDFFSRARIVQPGSAEIPRAPVQGKG